MDITDKYLLFSTERIVPKFKNNKQKLRVYPAVQKFGISKIFNVF